MYYATLHSLTPPAHISSGNKVTPPPLTPGSGKDCLEGLSTRLLFTFRADAEGRLEEAERKFFLRGGRGKVNEEPTTLMTKQSGGLQKNPKQGVLYALSVRCQAPARLRDFTLCWMFFPLASTRFLDNRWRIINQMFANSLPVYARVKKYC